MKLQARSGELEMVAYKTRPVEVLVYTAAFTTELVDDDGKVLQTIPKDHSLVLGPDEAVQVIEPDVLKLAYAPTRPRNPEHPVSTPPTKPDPKPRQRRSK